MSRVALFLAATLVLGARPFVGAARAQDVQIFQGEPPKAETLAEMLYPEPRRTRGIVIRPRPQPFGFLIQFDFDSAEIRPVSRPYLDEVGKMLSLQKTARRRLIIEGHTDAIGPGAYNHRLSERRAAAVSQYLAVHHGVELTRLVTVGKGESSPLKDKDPLDPLNRRVQFLPAE
jgi:outer membrane protein OmpA-like peptidoglycan-associated protein